MTRTSLAFLIFTAALCAGPARAQQAPAAPAAQAAALLEQGQPQQAYDLMLARHKADAADPDAAFLLAQAAARLGRHDEAASLYEGMLAANPALPRVRLELAREYAALGRTDKAIEQFQAVMKNSPPPLVGENIARYMGAMKKQKSWNARASLGYVYDTNVNAGPTADSVLMFGLPFTLSADSKEKSGSGYNFGTGAGWMGGIGRGAALQADAQYSRTSYVDLKPFDSDVLSFSAGPTLQKKNYMLSLPLLYEYVLIGHKSYSYSYGAAPQGMVPLGENWSLNSGFVLQKKTYYVGGGARDGGVWSFSAGAKYRYAQDAFLQATYRHGYEGTKEDYLDNNSDGLTLGWYTAMPWGLSLYLAPGFSYTRYAEAEAAYDDARKDKQYTAVANLSRGFGRVSAALGYTFTRNDSNLGLYDYVRGQLTAQGSLSF